jgi:hypothetical protein
MVGPIDIIEVMADEEMGCAKTSRCPSWYSCKQVFALSIKIEV